MDEELKARIAEIGAELNELSEERGLGFALTIVRGQDFFFGTRTKNVHKIGILHNMLMREEWSTALAIALKALNDPALAEDIQKRLLADAEGPDREVAADEEDGDE